MTAVVVRSLVTAVEHEVLLQAGTENKKNKINQGEKEMRAETGDDI